jgi:hypothetical protein
MTIRSIEQLHTDRFDTGNIAKIPIAGSGDGARPEVWFDDNSGAFYWHANRFIGSLRSLPRNLKKHSDVPTPAGGD